MTDNTKVMILDGVLITSVQLHHNSKMISTCVLGNSFWLCFDSEFVEKCLDKIENVEENIIFLIIECTCEFTLSSIYSRL